MPTGTELGKKLQSFIQLYDSYGKTIVKTKVHALYLLWSRQVVLGCGRDVTILFWCFSGWEIIFT